MTVNVTFYGASDDLIEVDGCPGADEFNRISGNWSGILASGTDQMAVHVDYRPPGVWSVGASQVDEGHPVPDWPVRFDEAHDYSVRMTVGCPGDVVLEEVTR